jgi:osmotically-inducible protein OsmY
MTSTVSGDPYLVERIRDALAQDGRVNELGLAIALVGTEVFVTGSVTTPERQASVAVVIRERFPDLEVHNDVTVQQVGAPPVRERLP